jgi:dienelactone hydrolase
VLDAVVTPTHERRLVEYATEPGERVQAFLLVPRRGSGPFPAALAIHQDGNVRPYAHGKSEPAGVGGDPELAYGRELCERGYVVVCPDRLGFESRSLATAPSAAPFASYRIFTRDGFELTEDLWLGCLANRLLYEGRVPFGRTLHELRRAVDYLCGLPEVDPTSVGVIGHSAGGLYGALAMYLDARIKVGCASCGTFLFRWNWGPDGTLRPINGFAGPVVPGMARWGDVDDVLAGLAPRPFLETDGEASYQSEEASAELTDKARARYAELGVPERFQYVRYDAGHVFRADMRARAYDWLDRWLRAAPATAE